MFQLSTLILTGLAGLFVGLSAGALLSRLLKTSKKPIQLLESQLEEAETKLKDYQHEVSEHFEEASALINNLSQSYKEVLEHQARNALKLSNSDISRQLIEAAEGKLQITGTRIDDLPLEPPKDWAPGQRGQLSEGFGLEKVN